MQLLFQTTDLDTIEVVCDGDNLEFTPPDPWPVCTDEAYCPTPPPNNPDVFTSDYTGGDIAETQSVA